MLDDNIKHFNALVEDIQNNYKYFYHYRDLSAGVLLRTNLMNLIKVSRIMFHDSRDFVKDIKINRSTLTRKEKIRKKRQIKKLKALDNVNQQL